MIENQALNIVSDLLIQKGKQALHSLFPRDFELYFCALELTDPDGNIVDYFQFPVMPKNITKTESEATTVQTSLSGVTIFNKDAYTPNNLMVSGDFGRSFKLDFFELGNLYKSLIFSIRDGYYTADDVNSQTKSKKKSAEIPMGIKSGYGSIKIMQSIIDKAKSHDSRGRTYRLYFYNLALGESYLVVPTKEPLKLSQSMPGDRKSVV